METQTHNQPQPTQPRRPRRKWLRWLAVPAAVAVLALVYQLTRPPELVWWRSGQYGNRKLRVKVQVPNGWRARTDLVIPTRNIVARSSEGIRFDPADQRPTILQRLFPNKPERGSVLIVQLEQNPGVSLTKGEVLGPDGLIYFASKSIVDHSHGTYWEITIFRSDKAAFNRTYQQICDSLTIE